MSKYKWEYDYPKNSSFLGDVHFQNAETKASPEDPQQVGFHHRI
jgi:hypothetical protein